MSDAKRLPRYTSYPTAPHFHTGVTSGDYKAWLSALGTDTDLSLYIHVPFCKQLCWFCGCHTRVVNMNAPVKRYMAEVAKEAELIARELKGQTVTHIHFGGGSPTLVEADDFMVFMETLRQHFNVSEAAEIAVEIDPRGLSKDKIAAYAACGVTRASLGVQDFDLTVQKAINRVQPFELVQECVADLRAAGIEAINLDLIYGLPHQTIETVERSVDLSLALSPSRVSLFGYAHVPWMKKHQQLIDPGALAGSEVREQMFEAAAILLAEAGYIAIGLDHFAHPDDEMARQAQAGELRRNFQGYTTDQAPALIGLGVSSISSLPSAYAQNTPDTISYAKAIAAGELPIARGLELSEEDQMRRDIIMGLMSHLELNLDVAAAPYGKSAADFTHEINVLGEYVKAGWVDIDGPTIRVVPSARARIRYIAAAFDAYLEDNAHRYSVAV